MSVVGQPNETAAMRAVIRERDEARDALTRGVKDCVSVVIPCYNQDEFLPAAVLSAVNQTRVPLEIIIVDDGSDVPVVAPDVPERFWGIPIRVVRVANRGLACARNTGLMLARGEWVVPLDADDVIEPTFIEATLRVAAETGADVIQTGIQEEGERHGAYRPGFDMPLEMVTDGHLQTTNRFWYCGLYRVSILRAVGGWNSRMSHLGGWEDWALHRDLIRRGVKYAEAPGFLFHYNVRPGSMATEADRNRPALLAEMKRQQLQHHA